MDLKEKKEIAFEAATMLIKEPNLSMRKVASRLNKCTSTTLKKIFDDILPEYYPDLKNEIVLAKNAYQEKIAREKYEASAKYKKQRRQLVKIEAASEYAKYIIENNATMQKVADYFNKPIANIQRSLNLLRAADKSVDMKLNQVFTQNKENYYKSLSGLTKEKIENIKRTVYYIGESENSIRKIAVKDLKMSPNTIRKYLRKSIALSKKGLIDEESVFIANEVVKEWTIKKHG